MSQSIRLSGFTPDDCVRALGAGIAVYVVGGAVRDELLGLSCTDRDWVVTGATPEKMVDAGFTPVGADFPVFLHPRTHEEYALARTERKTAAGYRGFVFHASPEVTLEADLQRRDLTVNAMAMSADGALVDPWGGMDDLNARVLRHVSPAFAEDPVRILRLARFAARFPQFDVHADTLAFCADMVTRGEVKALVAERVWQEVSRLLAGQAPAQGWRVLVQCGALPDLMGADAAALLCDVRALAAFSSDWVLAQRWAGWMLGAGMNTAQVAGLCAAWRVPAECGDLAQLCVGQYAAWLAASTAAQVAAVFAASDLYRRPERFAQAVAVMAVCRARTANAQVSPVSHSALSAPVWLQLADQAKALAVGVVAKQAAAEGRSIPDAVAAAREQVIGQALQALLK